MTVKHELTQELMAEMPPKLEYLSMVLAVVIWEFVYRMDCEGGEVSHATGNVGSTTVIGNAKI